MKLFVVSCLLALAGSSLADGGLGLGGLGAGLVYAPGHASADYYSYPAYAFEYSVNDPHTGDKKAQWEKRDGDVVKGAYSLVEPDGSVRVVEYYADDKTGFHADVKRLGPNLHPTGPVSVPIYKAPIPILGHGHGPITVGPVASLGHLADAPLITGPIAGPIHHAAVSSANLYKPVAKTLLPVAEPIVHAPISKPIYYPEPLPHAPAPILKPYSGYGPALGHGPILSEPIYKSGPILQEPILSRGYENLLPGPIYKSGPILREPHLLNAGHSLNHGPILSEPIYKAGPILSEPIYKSGPILSEPIYKSGPILSEPIYKSGPILSEPLYNYKSGPILREPLIQSYGHGPILSDYKSGPIFEGLNWGANSHLGYGQH